MARSKPEPRGDRPCHVLIVDDDPDTREVFLELFAAEGYCVSEAVDALAALAVLRGPQPPDVMVLDLLLPGIDGWTFLAQIRADPALKDTRVLVVSAVAHTRPSELATADAVAKKPVDGATLFDTVRELCLPYGPQPALGGAG